ncbi:MULTISPECIES: helix-turn-helix domain-containing protein [unclassified Streptomyces]|uniref:winged helix-turn-helix transcriptional regulator n=1 Tax=unclassified Streptomyces TaxID=2593676 RepID=UPI0006F72C76|nr:MULTISPECIES: helix-turn-helix domain-containing protein [unclassified Streptomyces]KQX46130.1 HxlR family transcriptional regulator [Streptomyces sp. Root1304]KRA80915.1 HxlR family transcriptional regulator [Streptomyces sp. Root66D1]
MTSDGYLADCRARLAFDLLANTWNSVVLWSLRGGPRRHGELRARIGGISSKVLTETLRRLEFNGLVERREAGVVDVPELRGAPRVTYELTPLGRTLLGPIDAFGAWAFEHGDEVMAAQERHGQPTALRGE